MAGWRFTTPGQEARRAEREGRTPPPTDWRSEARFWSSRSTYTRQTIPLFLLLIVLGAIGIMFAIHLTEAVRHGSVLSGWTAAVFAAIIFYPALRHRIERGRWPD